MTNTDGPKTYTGSRWIQIDGSATTLIENWEEDVNEWYGGIGNHTGRTTRVSFSGSYSYQVDSNNFGPENIYSDVGDGLPYYPSPSDTIIFYKRYDSSVTDNTNGGLYFGMQSTNVSKDSEPNQAYQAFSNTRGGSRDIQIIKRGGEKSDTANNTGFNFDEWMKFKIDWGTDGTISMTVTQGGSNIATVSINDTEYGQGGIGLNYGYGSSNGLYNIDYIHVL